MISLVTQADGSSRGQPWVTFTLAVVLVAGFAWTQTSDLAERKASIQGHFEEAIAYYESHPYLELDLRLHHRVGGEEGLQAIQDEFMSERRARGLSLIPSSIKRRTQKKLDGLVESGFAERRELPHWRLGVVDASSPPGNWFAHVTAHRALGGLVVGLVFLLCLGAAIEGAWGPLLFGGFCAVAVPAGAGVYVQLHGAAGVPWHGAGGLVAALLGAYAISALGRPALLLGGPPLPGWLLLTIWLPVEYFFVRGLSPGELTSGPMTAHLVALGFGAAVALVVRQTGIEESLRAKHAKNSDLVANPVLDRALAAHETGRSAEAYEMLKAEVAVHPRHHDLVLGLWTVARECGAEGEAAPHLLEIIRQELKRGKRTEAAEHWLELSDAAPHVSVEPALLVRLGEALLDEGQPNDALLTMARALDEPDRVPAPLARRIVRITRDLDPQITGRAAAAALRDDHLDPEERASLEALTQDIQPSAVRSSESDASPALTATGAVTAAASPEPNDAGRADPEARLSDSLSKEVSPEPAESARPAEHWNDPGLVEDLSTQLEDDSAPFDASGLDTSGFDSESFGAVDLDDVRAESDVVEASGGDPLDGLTDDPDDVSLSVLAESAESTTDARHGFLAEGPSDNDSLDAEDGSATAPILEDESGRTTAVEGLPAAPGEAPERALNTRRLKVLEGVPVGLDEAGIKVEIDGRGKTRLPLDRLEALAVAAVGGLGERPVLLVDLVLNWMAAPGEPLKVIRLRSDRFNPNRLVPGAESAVDALKSLLGRLLSESGATPLPNANAAHGAPFASYEDLASYQTDVLLVTQAD